MRAAQSTRSDPIRSDPIRSDPISKRSRDRPTIEPESEALGIGALCSPAHYQPAAIAVLFGEGGLSSAQVASDRFLIASDLRERRRVRCRSRRRRRHRRRRRRPRMTRATGALSRIRVQAMFRIDS